MITTEAGDRTDTLAYRAYIQEGRLRDLSEAVRALVWANPVLCGTTLVFDAGVVLETPDPPVVQYAAGYPALGLPLPDALIHRTGEYAP